jgi:hypothetical protein
MRFLPAGRCSGDSRHHGRHSERDYKIVLAEDAVSGIYEEGKKELRRIGVRIWPTNRVLEKVGLGVNGLE